MLVCEGFELVCPLVKPRVDQGHFGHFLRKRHFGCSASFWMFLWSHGKKIIFLDFLGFGMQIKGERNTVSTTAPCLSDISSAMRVVR